MSYQTATRTELSKSRGVFSGGYVDNVDNLDLADYYSPYLRNARLDGQSIVIRPGHSLFEELTAGSYPKGIGTYLRAIEANDVLVVRHNTDSTHKLVTLTEGGTATSISTGTLIGSDNRMFFQSVGDVIYCMNGADKMGVLNGTTYANAQAVGPTVTGINAQTTIAFVNSNPDTITDSGNGFLTGGFLAGQRIIITGSASNNSSFTIATVTAGTITLIASDSLVAEAAGASVTIKQVFAPAFSVSFAGSHWAAGWPAAPNKVYKSVSGDFADFTGAGATQYTFKESMTGLSANNQSLFYFTKNTISITGINDITDTAGTLTFTTRSLQAKEGATNHHSIVSVGANTYFVTPSNKICMIAQGTNVDGFEVMDLSHRAYKGIDKLMATLSNDQSTSFGYYLPDKNLIKRHFKLNGSTFNDICVVYDVTKDTFLVDNQKYFYDGCFFHNKAYTISMIEPKVFLDEYGPDDEGDEGVGIPFEYWTKKFYVSKPPNRKKILRESRTTLDMSELAEPTQEIFMDDVVRDTKTLGADDIPDAPSADPIAVKALGTGGDYDSDDYEPVEILRTKGNLNKKGKNIQFRYTNGSLAGKVRLKDVAILVEVLPGLASNLT